MPMPPSQVISKFDGEYGFLSNFWMTDVKYNGIIYPSSEHAYQASKSLDESVRIKISNLRTPGQAKREGSKLNKREDWDRVKVSIMRDILTLKFRNPIMRDLLMSTKGKTLIEGNTWGDTFWGVCNGEGHNHLGKLLMEVRDAIAAE